MPSIPLRRVWIQRRRRQGRQCRQQLRLRRASGRKLVRMLSGSVYGGWRHKGGIQGCSETSCGLNLGRQFEDLCVFCRSSRRANGACPASANTHQPPPASPGLPQPPTALPFIRSLPQATEAEKQTWKSDCDIEARAAFETSGRIAEVCQRAKQDGV